MPAGAHDPSFRCSQASEAADEPLLGTASTITNWLLLEHPGPWGERALHHARLPDGLGATLLRRERELRIRVLLIRRHGRAAGGAPACFAIHTGPDRPWMERADLNDVRDVATLDLDALGHGRSVGLAPVDTPCSRSARTVVATRVARSAAVRSRRHSRRRSPIRRGSPRISEAIGSPGT